MVLSLQSTTYSFVTKRRIWNSINSIQNKFYHRHPYLQQHQQHQQHDIVKPNPSLVNLTHAPINFNPQSALVYENFLSSLPSLSSSITNNEYETVLQNDLLKLMKRRRFEKGHWDAVITNYKEIEIPYHNNQDESRSSVLSHESCLIIEHVRRHIEQTYFRKDNNTCSKDPMDVVKWLQPHAIYLKDNGILSAHVDSVKFSGRIVAGLSLLSTAIMRLKPASPSEIESSEVGRSNNIDSHDHSRNVGDSKKYLDNAGHVDLLLPPMSLYVLSDMSRYQYTHELLESGHSFIDKHGNETVVNRKDRISVIFRDAKQEL